MSSPDKSYLQVLSELEQWGSYETSAQPRDISKLEGIRLLLRIWGIRKEHLRLSTLPEPTAKA